MSDTYTLIYDGTLSPLAVNHLKWMMREGYTFWVEFAGHPENFNQWSEQAMEKRYIVKGNDIEGYSSGWRTLFSVVKRSPTEKSDSVVFYGFKSQKERDACAQQYFDILISAEPFKTGF